MKKETRNGLLFVFQRQPTPPQSSNLYTKICYFSISYVQKKLSSTVTAFLQKCIFPFFLAERNMASPFSPSLLSLFLSIGFLTSYYDQSKNCSPKQCQQEKAHHNPIGFIPGQKQLWDFFAKIAGKNRHIEELHHRK